MVDTLFVPVRRDMVTREKAMMMVSGITESGQWEPLDFEGAPTENAHGREALLQRLRERGVQEVWTVVMDGMPGLDEAVRRVSPQAHIRRCTVHKISRR